MKHVIYGLYDPRKETEIRYVGYTGKRIERRLIEHISEAKNSTIINHRYNWLRSLSKAGIKPSIIILEEVSKENWKEREQFWIAKFDNLVNSTAGGEGLINPSQDVKDKISAKVTESLQGNKRRLGVPHTEESRKAISNGLRNSEKKKAFDKSRIGINSHANLTEEQKLSKGLKISKARLNCPTRIFNEEARKNISNGHKGLKHSTETKDKIALANIGNSRALGNILSTDSKNEISESKKGRKFANNGIDCILLKKDELLPTGWQFGMLKRSK